MSSDYYSGYASGAADRDAYWEARCADSVRTVAEDVAHSCAEEWRARARALIVRACENLVQTQHRAGALDDGWDDAQWRVEAEIIADRLLSEQQP